jgi:hypothetical protein
MSSRSIVVAFLSAASVVCPSCYHFRVAPPGPEAPGTEPNVVTGHAYVWGLIQDPNPVLAENCGEGGALYDVRVTTNFGYTLLTVLSLGFWSPMEIEWRCAKKPPPNGVLRPTPRPPRPDEPQN